MATCSSHTSWIVAILALALAAPAAAQTTEPPATSPDGLWQVVNPADLPERLEVPTQFVALTLDEGLLTDLLADAPRETVGAIPPRVQIWLPPPGGGFAPAFVAETQLMEPALAVQLPEIATYAFTGGGIAGHLATGPGGFYLSAQTGEAAAAGLWRIEPVEADGRRFYLSFFDRRRTDGADVIVHDPHMGEHDEPSVPGFDALRGLALPASATEALEAGDQLRIYRLAASTTGEFYQARGGNLLSVVFSLVVDLIGANAVFEPEVSVRLVLAAASLDVLYDDPADDPFDNSDTPCELRDDNRDNMKLVLDDGDYDLGFLFATRGGGGASGCAWYVVCLTASDTLHKARGAGKMGNNGTNGASGLLAHEVGHQLGARHTFTGQAGSCTLNEFLAGDSESGYEPGSGTTRMSYNGNCDSDDVDTTAVPAGSYFHSRSFDEIVGNVFGGDGATCGTLVLTGNSPPVVDAGPDYTIPRQTPFTLTGSGLDDEPLTFNWEQFDRAVTQRPIDTDLGDGPIIRSVPPGALPTRTVPRLEDLLDGITRAGEILPQVDRELNFRLVARDNLMGGGGVAYDSMRLTVVGDPFFITSPDSGALEAGCQVPLTWEVGGGSVAAQVEAFFDDGGHTFATPLTGAVPNDGADGFEVPCALGTEGRIKLQSVDNVFFDVNDQDLTVSNTPPTVEVATAGGAVDDSCELLVEFTASATDACGLSADDVTVELSEEAGSFTLGTPMIALQQVSPTEVAATGSVLVSDLLGSPAVVGIRVTAADGCGAEGDDFVEATVVDDAPPVIDVTLDPDSLWPPNHALVPIEAQVAATDNCPGVAFTLTGVTSDEPENGTGDGDTAPDVAGTDFATPDLLFELRSERAGHGDGRTYTVTYTAEDGSGNQTQDSATIEVPKSRKP